MALEREEGPRWEGWEVGMTRWKGPDLGTFFRWGHVIVRWRRFEFLFHWPSRTFVLILWRWHQPHGEIFLRSFGIVFKDRRLRWMGIR